MSNPVVRAQTLATQDAAAVAAAVQAAAEAEVEKVPDKYPIVYYNPKVLDEWFYLIGSPYKKRFANGRFVATNDIEDASVVACLSAWGPEKPDRWRGDDNLSRDLVDRRSGFRTRNPLAFEDYDYYHNS